MESEGKPKIRILAYIDKFDPPYDDNQDAVKLMMTDTVKGFWLDVTVELDGPRGRVTLEHIGDGKVYETLEEAEEVVLQEVGIKVERLPEPPSGTRWSCAAFFIGEFGLTDKPMAQIVAEGSMPSARNPDHSRRPEQAQ